MFGRNIRMKKKLWIVTELYFPEESATSYIFTKIAEGLANEFDVSVITGQPDYTKKITNILKNEYINNVYIERCNIPSFDKNKLLFRIIRAILLSILLSYQALKRVWRGDVVLVVTNPATLLFFMIFVCMIKRARFLILVHDVFPENLLAANIVKNVLIIKIINFISNFPYRKASKVISIGRDMALVLQRKIAAGTPTVEVITNWADCDNIFPQNKNSNFLIKELRLEEKFIIEFAGNIGRVQGVEYLVQAIDLIKDEGVHFLFIGNGAKRYLLEKKVEEQSLRNITILDTRHRSEQNIFLNACDIGLITLAPGMYGLGVPSKAYNIMAAGKPIIAAVEADSEIGLMVIEENIGWVVSPGSPQALVNAIIDAKSDPDRLRKMGTRSRIVAENKYSFPKVLERYKIVVNQALN
jgi:glycosyltransferase involved in cell wall biosynthesis